MKKYLIYSLLKKAQKNPEFYKKLKIGILIGSAGFLVITGLLVWAGYSLVSHTVATVSNMETPVQIQNQIEKIKTSDLLQNQLEQNESGKLLQEQIKKVETVKIQDGVSQVLGCFASLEKKLDLQVLATHSFESLWNSIMASCFSQSEIPSKNEGTEGNSSAS